MVKPRPVREVLQAAPEGTLSVVAVSPEEWAALADGLRIDWVAVDPALMPFRRLWGFLITDPEHWLLVQVVRIRGAIVTIEAVSEDV